MFDYDPLARATPQTSGVTATETPEQVDSHSADSSDLLNDPPNPEQKSHYGAPPYAAINDFEDDYGLGPEEPPTFDPPPYVPVGMDVGRRIPPPLEPAADIPAPIGSPRFFAENGLSPEQYAPGNITGPQITDQQITGHYMSITGQPGIFDTAMGMGMEEEPPPQVTGITWNWGAFLIPFGWCLRFRMPKIAFFVGLLYLAIQIVCSIVPATTILLTGVYFVAEGMAATYLGLHGWRIGWANRPPDLNTAAFVKEQKAWISWGLMLRAVYVISIIGRIVWFVNLP